MTICKEDNCTTRSTYGKPDSKKAEYCNKHKPSDYINVKDKTCLEVNCTTRPSYGKPDSKKA